MRPSTNPVRYTNGKPDPTVLQIEEALRRSRFEESSTDRFLARRALKKASQSARNSVMNERERRAFIAGFEAASARDIGYFLFALIGWLLTTLWIVALVAGWN